MIQFFGIPIDTFTSITVVIAGVIVAIVLLLGIANLLFFKIGVRNIWRRRAQMVLIIFALMLSTTLLSSVLGIGDILTSAVQSVAVYNWGNIDEVIEGGHGALATYPDGVYYRLVRHQNEINGVSAIGAAFREQDLLVADETSRQVRASVTGLGVIPGSELGFGGLHDVTTHQLSKVSSLKANTVYLNATLAQLLNARKGDTLYLYSSRWTGKRYTMQVAGVVANSGIVGDNPYMIAQVGTFQNIESLPDNINQVLIANRGGGGVNGVDLSNSVSDSVDQFLPPDVHVIPVKEQGVQNSQQAEEIFTRIFTFFALFTLVIGLLLIFLIFILLAAERRSEMGMARAIGMQRRHLVMMFLFEGAVYDLLASFVGLLFGVGLGVLIFSLLGPLLTSFNFPLKLTIQPHSLILAYCLGVIFTFFAVVISSWLVSRMTIIDAIHNLPDTERPALTVPELLQRMAELTRQLRESLFSVKKNRRRARRLLFEFYPDVLLEWARLIIVWGFVPLLLGFVLMHYGLEQQQDIPFSLGLTLLLLGGALLIKTFVLQTIRMMRRREKSWDGDMRRSSRFANGLVATVVGLLIMAYWALPFDALVGLGLPRFQGGIEVFFVAAIMMVSGSVWALMANARWLVEPWVGFFSRLPRVAALTRLATVYPLDRQMRTALSVIMFSLVVFAMTVMVIITNAMQNSYVNINTQTGGYDIQATAYFKALPDLQSSLTQHGLSAQSFSAIGVRRTTVAGVVQLGADAPRWSIYPVEEVTGGFLQGYGLNLTARANGFKSNADVWKALQTHPDYALIDSSALPQRPSALFDASSPSPTSPGIALPGAAPTLPGNIDPRYVYSVSGVYQGDNAFPAIPIWVQGFQGSAVRKFTIIGVVDNSDGAHTGLYIPGTLYSAASLGKESDVQSSQDESYYFKVAPGQDAHKVSLALGSAYLDYGLETTVLQDVILQTRGPRILLSDVLLGVVALTLLLGVAALALTGTRAVIERRQQIGMLRALGVPRPLIQGAFLLESFLVGVTGSVLGGVLGLILARNIFAANFFEQYQTGLFFSIPWSQLALVVVVAFVAAFLGAVLPAWQAGRVAPAEALRYT